MNAVAEASDGWVALMLRPYGTDKRPGLTVVAAFYTEMRDVGVVPPLASANVSMPGSGAGDLDAACLSAVYELDKEMYRRATGISHPQR